MSAGVTPGARGAAVAAAAERGAGYGALLQQQSTRVTNVCATVVVVAALLFLVLYVALGLHSAVPAVLLCVVMSAAARWLSGRGRAVLARCVLVAAVNVSIVVNCFVMGSVVAVFFVFSAALPLLLFERASRFSLALVALALGGRVLTFFGVGAQSFVPGAAVLQVLNDCTTIVLIVFIGFYLSVEQSRSLGVLAETVDSLHAAMQQTQVAVAAKSRFVASMSHELRTPLNSILVGAELLRDAVTSAEHRDTIQLMQTSGDALCGLISDILDFSRLDSNRMQLNWSVFSLRGCLDDAVQVCAPAAYRKGVHVFCRVDSSVRSALYADEARVRQLIINLLSNAVKFTAHGSVSVLASRLSASEAAQLVSAQRRKVSARNRAPSNASGLQHLPDGGGAASGSSGISRGDSGNSSAAGESSSVGDSGTGVDPLEVQRQVQAAACSSAPAGADRAAPTPGGAAAAAAYASSRAPVPDVREYVLLRVRDTGIGIPDDMLESIFQPFYQGDIKRVQAFGGSGLGLAICRQIVAVLGGFLWAGNWRSRMSSARRGSSTRGRPVDALDSEHVPGSGDVSAPTRRAARHAASSSAPTELEHSPRHGSRLRRASIASHDSDDAGDANDEYAATAAAAAAASMGDAHGGSAAAGEFVESSGDAKSAGESQQLRESGAEMTILLPVYTPVADCPLQGEVDAQQLAARLAPVKIGFAGSLELAEHLQAMCAALRSVDFVHFGSVRGIEACMRTSTWTEIDVFFVEGLWLSPSAAAATAAATAAASSAAAGAASGGGSSLWELHSSPVRRRRRQAMAATVSRGDAADHSDSSRRRDDASLARLAETVGARVQLIDSILSLATLGRVRQPPPVAVHPGAAGSHVHGGGSGATAIDADAAPPSLRSHGLAIVVNATTPVARSNYSSLGSAGVLHRELQPLFVLLESTARVASHRTLGSKFAAVLHLPLTQRALVNCLATVRAQRHGGSSASGDGTSATSHSGSVAAGSVGGGNGGGGFGSDSAALESRTSLLFAVTAPLSSAQSFHGAFSTALDRTGAGGSGSRSRQSADGGSAAPAGGSSARYSACSSPRRLPPTVLAVAQQDSSMLGPEHGGNATLSSCNISSVLTSNCSASDSRDRFDATPRASASVAAASAAPSAAGAADGGGGDGGGGSSSIGAPVGAAASQALAALGQRTGSNSSVAGAEAAGSTSFGADIVAQSVLSRLVSESELTQSLAGHSLPPLHLMEGDAARSEAAASTAAATLHPASTLSILVADDTAANRHVMSLVLRKFNCASSVYYASTGLEALQVCSEHPEINTIFMDLRMPEMDGLEAVAVLRERGCDAYVCAFTAGDLTEESPVCRAAGCNGFLSKPVTSGAVEQILLASLARIEGAPSSSNESALGLVAPRS